VQLFHTRFDPRENLASAESKVREELAATEALMQKVESLDEDRILRHFVNAVTAATRTNFYQIDADGRPKAQIAIKLQASSRRHAAAAAPLRNLRLFAAVEGVHLRFGKVARGGIRWSDRPQDFRTEVLGLVKASRSRMPSSFRSVPRGASCPNFYRMDRARLCRRRVSLLTSCSYRRCWMSPTISVTMA